MLNIDKKKLLYRLKLIRLVEEEIANKYFENQMRCPTHLCTGQEAVASVVGYLLKKEDYVVSTHRSHGHYLGKGGDLKKNDCRNLWQIIRLQQRLWRFNAFN